MRVPAWRRCLAPLSRPSRRFTEAHLLQLPSGIFRCPKRAHMLSRCPLLSARLAPVRAGLRGASQQWWASVARPGSTARVAAAAATVEAEAPAASSSTQQVSEPPAYRAYIDFKFIRDNVDAVAANCRDRLSTADPHAVAKLYEEYVAAQQETDKLRAARNENSSAMKVGLACRRHRPACRHRRQCLLRGKGCSATFQRQGCSTRMLHSADEATCHVPRCRASWSRSSGRR